MNPQIRCLTHTQSSQPINTRACTAGGLGRRLTQCGLLNSRERAHIQSVACRNQFALRLQILFAASPSDLSWTDATAVSAPREPVFENHATAAAVLWLLPLLPQLLPILLLSHSIEYPLKLIVQKLSIYHLRAHNSLWSPSLSSATDGIRSIRQASIAYLPSIVSIQ